MSTWRKMAIQCRLSRTACCRTDNYKKQKECRRQKAALKSARIPRPEHNIWRLVVSCHKAACPEAHSHVALVRGGRATGAKTLSMSRPAADSDVYSVQKPDKDRGWVGFENVTSKLGSQRRIKSTLGLR